MSQPRNWWTSTRSLASDVTRGFLALLHNSFALIGLTVAFALAALLLHPTWRADGEAQLRQWLQSRHIAVVGFTPAPDAIERATAVNPKALPKEQAAVAYWISKKYNVAPEPMAALVAEAYEQGNKQGIDPTLILAVMAIESRFNPFAQSAVGAQGLMQVMTRVHTDKYENFGGNHAAFDPVSNLRVGAAILKEYIGLTGSVEGGLKYYVGAANLEHDGGYANKVLAEYRRLRQVAGKPATAPALVASKRMVTPMKRETETLTPVENDSVAAADVTDTADVQASSNL